MDHRQLRYFLALAETLHFGRASERCHISAPTLSRNIKQLEETLGMALFERDNRSVKLTRVGVAFIDYANATLANWQRFKQGIENDANVLTGEVSIYCSVTASYSFLYQLLERLRSEHSGIEIKLHTGDPAQAIDRVLDGHEQVAIAAKPEKLPAQLAFTSIGFSPLVFIAPKIPCEVSECLAQSETIPWQSLPFIVPEQGLNRKHLEDWWRKQGVHARIYAQVTGHEAMVSMVSLGLGVALVPRIVLDTSPLADKVRILPVADSPPPFEIGLAVLRKALHDPVINAIWQLAETL